MFQKYVRIAAMLTILAFLLGACGQATPVPATDTPQPPAATSTSVPPTATVTPEPGMSYEQSLPLFEYDPSTPFNVYVNSEKEKDGVITQEIAYMAADPKFLPKTAGKVVAILVKPAKEGSYAGILYLHGLGEGWGNREEFLDEAVELAHQGVVSLLPMGLFPWMVTFTGDGQIDQTSVIKQVIELRRSLDFLLAQPGVDPKRIAFVGHDYGAMHGAVLSGIEKRVKAYVLMAGDDNYTDWAVAEIVRPADVNAFRRLLSAIDPVVYLPHAAPATLFFQFGGNDSFVIKEHADRSFNAGSEPKQLGWYADAPHILNDQARQERQAWLALQLDLKPAP